MTPPIINIHTHHLASTHTSLSTTTSSLTGITGEAHHASHLFYAPDEGADCVSDPGKSQPLCTIRNCSLIDVSPEPSTANLEHQVRPSLRPWRLWYVPFPGSGTAMQTRKESRD